VIIISEDEGFDFGSLLKKKKTTKNDKKEEQMLIDDFKSSNNIFPEPEPKVKIPIPENKTTDQYGVPVVDGLIREEIRKHPIVQEFTAMMDSEVEKTNIGFQIIEKIESLETNYDLDFMQKLITIKNVLNYTQSSWSFGVCKEIIDGISIRGSRKKIALGLISTIKKMAKLS
jgi:hypothetical protein